MAMKDESQLTLQTPAKDPTSLKSHYDPVVKMSNGVLETHVTEDNSRPKRNNTNMGHVITCREESTGEGGGVVSSLEGEQKDEEEGREEARIEGPTTRSDNKQTAISCCMKCDTEHSDVWHTTHQGIVLCSSCSQESTNSKSYKNKMCKRINNLHSRKIAPKGTKKNKEGKLKKSSYKLPYKEATYITANQIYYKGLRYKVGDVFSIRGQDRLYYVCVRSFMEDPLCNQYAVIIWLLPLYPNPLSYNPNDFLLGPAEDVPRPLDCLSFVSHDPPQGHITLNELRCYDDMPELWEGRREEGKVEHKGSSGLDLLLEAMEPDIHKIR
ncbi:hypothetical protein ACHWQZ_G005619 [Mnemiopsis leidyi]